MRAKGRLGVKGVLLGSLLVLGCSNGSGAGKANGAAGSGGASGGATVPTSSGGSGGSGGVLGGSGGSPAVATGGASGGANLATGGAGGGVVAASGGQGGTNNDGGVSGQAGAGASAGSGMAGAPMGAGQTLPSSSCTATADWCQHLQTSEGLSASFVTLNGAGEVFVAADSGFIQTMDLGGGLSGGQDITDLAVAKYTADGALVWSRLFGSPTVDEFVGGLASDASGNIFVAGDCHDKDANGGVFLAKLSSQGDVLWSQIPVAFDSSKASSLAVDAQGNAVLMEQGGRLRKFSPNGDVLWSAVVPVDGLGGGVAIDSSGNVFAGGHNAKGLLAKFSSAGAVTWMKDVGDNVTESQPIAIKIDGNGELVMIMAALSGGRSLSRYSSAGTLIWNKPMEDALYTLDALSLDGQGNTFVVGMSNDFAQTNFGTYLAEYSPTGDRRWGADLGIRAGSRNRDVISSPAGVAFVTGTDAGSSGPS